MRWCYRESRTVQESGRLPWHTARAMTAGVCVAGDSLQCLTSIHLQHVDYFSPEYYIVHGQEDKQYWTERNKETSFAYSPYLTSEFNMWLL